MKATIRLFNGVPIEGNEPRRASAEMLKKTLPFGFLFGEEVYGNYSPEDMDRLIAEVKEEIGISAEQANNAFHKSWQKVKNANIEDLVIEQLIHYYTTYGFEELGIYDKSTVYVPREALNLPQIDDYEKIPQTIIRGFTKIELKEKLMNLLTSGIALQEDVMKDILEVALFVGITDSEIASIKNKEVKIMLYDLLGRIPDEPVEFLRYIIYKVTGKTLIIKDRKTIELLKAEKLDVLILFIRYEQVHGLKSLAEIFYRFKPLFLALKTNPQMCTKINKIRKLAVKNHKPMKEDFLNSITGTIRSKRELHIDKLEEELAKVNTFRKIRLAYALKYRNSDARSILYKIRNGRGWATDFYTPADNQELYKLALGIVIDSIIKDIRKNVEGKYIYIPKNIKYALPATQKQFTGSVPSGTSVRVDKDMVFGIHWGNVKDNRIDLDLSLISIDTKYGWDDSYRSENGAILFSGDMTDAPLPKGATEAYYVKRRDSNDYLMIVNYYNHHKDVEVPVKIFVSQEQIRSMNDFIVNPNNILASVKTIIKDTQKILGLITVSENGCKFYFSEIQVGKGITSSKSNYTEHTRKYLMNSSKNSLSLNKLLEKAGAIMTDSKDKADIDLSLENLNKNTIIDLLK